MVSDNLVAYIEKLVHKGFSVDDAKNNLVKAGHNVSKVELAASKASKKGDHTFIIVSVIIAIVILGVLVTFMNRQEPVLEQPKLDFNKLNSVVQSGDITACEQFDLAKRNLCIKAINNALGKSSPEPESYSDVIALAAKEQNISLCADIKSSVQRTICEFGAGAERKVLAKEEFNDLTNTTQPTFYQIEDNIIVEVSQTGDASLCEQITNPVKKQLCLAESEG